MSTKHSIKKIASWSLQFRIGQLIVFVAASKTRPIEAATKINIKHFRRSDRHNNYPEIG